MPNFQVTTSKMQISLPWYEVTDFKSKNKLFDEKGFAVNPGSNIQNQKIYIILYKKSRDFGSFELMIRKTIGIALSIVSLGVLYYYYKPVYNLATKNKESIRYAVLFPPLSPDPNRNNEKNDQLNLKNPNETNADHNSKPIVQANLFMSISGNPVHLGHLAAVASGIRELASRSIFVEKAYISLEPQNYLKSKVKFENIAIDCENERNKTNKPHKVELKENTRIELLEKTIAYASKVKMFQYKKPDGTIQEAKCEYWNDQDKGDSDHPQSYYQRLAAGKTHRLYFVAGTDLCHAMHNWKAGINKINHAIIVTRGKNDSIKLEQDLASKYLTKNNLVIAREKDSTNFSRLIIENKFPHYEDYSSSKIQEGTLKLPNIEMQDIFDKAKKEAAGI